MKLLRKMLEDYWYVALPSRKLKSKPVSITLFAKPYVIFKSQGKVFALEDRCAHRHAPLSKGKICDGHIECPYHGWQYDHTGSLKYIPSVGKPKQSLKIKSFPTIDDGAYIWICPSGTPRQEAPLPFLCLNEKGYSTFRLQNRFAAPVEHCLENFLDCPHAAHVHNFWFRTPAKQSVKAIVRTFEDGAEVEYFQEPRKKSIVWWMLSDTKSSMRHTDRFIAPATSRVEYIFDDHRHYIITSHCSPISNQLTEVYTTITFKLSKIAFLIKPLFHALSKIIIKQDVKMIAQQAITMSQFSESHFMSTEADLMYPHICSFRKAIIDNLPLPTSTNPKEVDIIL